MPGSTGACRRRSTLPGLRAAVGSFGAARWNQLAQFDPLEDLKRNNLWIIGLDERGTSDYDHFDFTGDCVLVLGREGAGLHELVRLLRRGQG